MISDAKALEGRAEERFAALCAAERQVRYAADISGVTGDIDTKRRLRGQASDLSKEMLRAESELQALRERRYRGA